MQQTSAAVQRSSIILRFPVCGKPPRRDSIRARRRRMPSDIPRGIAVAVAADLLTRPARAFLP
jgi:hypothetical protein